MRYIVHVQKKKISYFNKIIFLLNHKIIIFLCVPNFFFILILLNVFN